MTGTFTLTNSALIYPTSSFDPAEEHFAVLLDGQEVGTIYRISDEWLWSINLGMLGMGAGLACSRREVRQAFRAEWDAKAARIGAAHVERALAVARGRP